MILGCPKHIRSDNGPEFTSKAVKKWLGTRHVGPLFIEPGSPWGNGYIESFNGKLKDECLNGELLLSRAEAKYVVDRWRMDYNHHSPHSMLNWKTPAEFAALCPERGVPCVPPGSATPHPPEHTENMMTFSPNLGPFIMRKNVLKSYVERIVDYEEEQVRAGQRDKSGFDKRA